MSAAPSVQNELERAFETLAAWCQQRDYAGHDPFDALNSRLFQSTPLRRKRAARLLWTQVFKRSPVNLRALARVPTEKNPKGIALFAMAALARFRTKPTVESEREARLLLDELLDARLGNGAWGYNFDWQGRAFFAPRGTPTVVPTAFAVRALVEAASAFNEEKNSAAQTGKYGRAARGACDFILNDLARSVETADEVCFSYTPLDRTRVFNASLLAAESLASVGALNGETDLLDLAVRGARYVVRRQRADGSWAYGEESYQSWADNFHTAFVLVSLTHIMKLCDGCRGEFKEARMRGYQFWRDTFFLADGWPKYYHDRLYPADAHSAGAAVAAFLEMRDVDAEALELARRVALWAVRNLRDERGYFYYQRRRFYTVRTPYMRWTQSWMLYALARLLEDEGQQRLRATNKISEGPESN